MVPPPTHPRKKAIPESSRLHEYSCFSVNEYPTSRLPSAKRIPGFALFLPRIMKAPYK